MTTGGKHASRINPDLKRSSCRIVITIPHSSQGMRKIQGIICKITVGIPVNGSIRVCKGNRCTNRLAGTGKKTRIRPQVQNVDGAIWRVITIGTDVLGVISLPIVQSQIGGR